MKVLAVTLSVLCCFSSVILAAETSTKKSVEVSDNKEKRGTVTAGVSYATAKPATVTSADVAYATAKVVPKVQYAHPAQLQYLSQPQQLLRYTQVEQQPQQQHQYYYEQQQPVATAVKYSSAAPAKVAYTAAQPNPNHIQYSLASDVSSFSYNSPLVAYNSLGLLSQHLGKAPVAAASVQPSHQHQQQQQIAYHQPQVVAKQQPVQVASYQQPQVAYQAVAQPSSGGKVAATYVVAAQPQYQHGGQYQQVAYAQQQQPHYTYTQIPQQYTSSRAHAQEYSSEPQYIAVPAHHAPQQQYYYQQAAAAPQTHQITREQYAHALQAAQQQQAHAQQSQQVQYQQVEPAQQYTREYTVSSAGSGQHSAPHAAYSIAPEYYREQAQYVQGYQHQQGGGGGKYSGGQAGIQYA